MPTRIVTGHIHTPEGEPWPDFQLNFTVTPSVTLAHATLPYKTVMATTDADGAFSIPLEVNVRYEVDLYTALIRRGTSTQYPQGSRFSITVPEGDGPISLSTIRASEIPDPADPTLPNLVAVVQDDLAALQAGLPGQIVEAIAADPTVTDAAAAAATEALYALTAGIDGGHPDTTYDGGIVADGGTP